MVVVTIGDSDINVLFISQHHQVFHRTKYFPLSISKVVLFFIGDGGLLGLDSRNAY